ncbi:MAG: tetratricopeptide repeat protein [Janthinobacterium lividum]
MGTGLRTARHILALPLLLFVSGCVSPPPRVDVAAEERTAHDPHALMHIADAAEASGDYGTAATFYRRTASLYPADPAPFLGFARSLAEQNHTGEAVAVLEDALPHMNGADTNRLRGVLSRLLIASHRPTEAVLVLRAALAQTPNMPGLLIGLGVALDASRDFTAAQASYRKALAIEPQSIAARNDLALSRALDGDSKDALEALQALRNRVVEDGGHAADLATIDGNLALVHAMRGELRQAGEAGSGATETAGDLAGNMRFYSALLPARVADPIPIN